MTDTPLASRFVQARWYTSGHNLPVNRIVLHSMEAREKGDTAESVARYFSTVDQKKSAHYTIDSNSIVQCVREADIAYHAPPNTGSIGLEHSGYSAQKRGDWLDAYGRDMLALSSKLCADLCRRHSIPIRFLTISELLDGMRGITTHNNVSLAWHKSSHTDPGPDFPLDYYLSLVDGWSHEPHVIPGEPMTPEQEKKYDAKILDIRGAVGYVEKALEERTNLILAKLDALEAKVSKP